MFFFRKEVGKNLLTMLNREGLESMENISPEGLVVTVRARDEVFKPIRTSLNSKCPSTFVVSSR